MVGDGARVHPERLGLLDQFRNAIGPVEQAVVRVAVEMNERVAHSRLPIVDCRLPMLIDKERKTTTDYTDATDK
jgi:hypothetical protein